MADCAHSFSFAISPTSLAAARETSGCTGSFGAVFLRIRHLQPGLRVRRGHSASDWFAQVRTTVLSETRLLGAGLTLLRVLRGGLELGECLGRLGRANDSNETSPRNP